MPRNFFTYTIESIPLHRKHLKFARDPDFQVAVAVPILRIQRREVENAIIHFQQKLFFTSKQLLSIQREGFAGERNLSSKYT